MRSPTVAIACAMLVALAACSEPVATPPDPDVDAQGAGITVADELAAHRAGQPSSTVRWNRASTAIFHSRRAAGGPPPSFGQDQHLPRAGPVSRGAGGARRAEPWTPRPACRSSGGRIRRGTQAVLSAGPRGDRCRVHGAAGGVRRDARTSRRHSTRATRLVARSRLRSWSRPPPTTSAWRPCRHSPWARGTG